MSISQNYPTVRPQLLIDIANTELLDSRVVSSRATVGTYYDKFGVLQTASANVPRVGYNPSTGAVEGLIREAQGTNLMTYSEEFDNAVWSKTNSTVTANTIVAPDGTLTGDELVENTANSTHNLQLSPTPPAIGTYTLSSYAKADSRSGIVLLASGSAVRAVVAFDLLTSSVRAQRVVGSSTITEATITAVENGWYRCTMTFVFGAVINNLQMGIDDGTSALGDNGVVYTGDGYSGIFIWGAQLEAGAFPTSYIPTVASQVTRSADLASMTGANFSSWYRADEGTLYADFAPVGVPTTGWHYWFTLSSSTGTLIAIRQFGTLNNKYRTDVNSATQNEIDLGASVVGVYKKVAINYKVNNVASSFDGNTAVADTSALIPVVNRLDIGFLTGTTGRTNLHLKKLSYFPARLSNEELQEMTS